MPYRIIHVPSDIEFSDKHESFTVTFIDFIQRLRENPLFTESYEAIEASASIKTNIESEIEIYPGITLRFTEDEWRLLYQAAKKPRHVLKIVDPETGETKRMVQNGIGWDPSFVPEMLTFFRAIIDAERE